MSQKNLVYTAFIILLVGLSRLIPHWPNFTAIGASAIWMSYAWHQQKNSVTLFSKSIFIPLIALFLSDWIIGFHEQMIWVYGALLLNGFLLQKRTVELNPLSIIQNSILISSLFFLITNFGVWYSFSYYPHTPSGFVSCFIAALPFLKYEFAGTLFYSTLGVLCLQKIQLVIPRFTSAKTFSHSINEKK